METSLCRPTVIHISVRHALAAPEAYWRHTVVFNVRPHACAQDDQVRFDFEGPSEIRIVDTGFKSAGPGHNRPLPGRVLYEGHTRLTGLFAAQFPEAAGPNIAAAEFTAKVQRIEHRDDPRLHR